MSKLYIYPKCSTCKKAVKYLSDRGVDVAIKDISQTPPTKTELQTMLKAYDGDIRKLFNTSGQSYRELGMKDRMAEGLSATEALKLLSDDGMLIKRPFLLTKDKALVGFKEQEWENTKF